MTNKNNKSHNRVLRSCAFIPPLQSVRLILKYAYYYNQEIPSRSSY